MSLTKDRGTFVEISKACARHVMQGDTNNLHGTMSQVLDRLGRI
jgi:hypothetical protein